MDRHMPNMDGVEATKEIRSQPHWDSLPIIALTASVSLKDKAECLDAGMNEYLLKPLLPEKALAIISKYCHQCRKLVNPLDKSGSSKVYK
jgi:CheY-like chemotaxis protein